MFTLYPLFMIDKHTTLVFDRLSNLYLPMSHPTFVTTLPETWHQKSRHWRFRLKALEAESTTRIGCAKCLEGHFCVALLGFTEKKKREKNRAEIRTMFQQCHMKSRHVLLHCFIANFLFHYSSGVPTKSSVGRPKALNCPLSNMSPNLRDPRPLLGYYKTSWIKASSHDEFSDM